MKPEDKERADQYREAYENPVLCDVSCMLSRNKSREWKKSVIRMETALVKFLHDYELIAGIEPFDENGDLRHDTVIRKKDLTDEGYQLFRQGIVDGWSDYLDRSTAPGKYENTGRLERGLRKIRTIEKNEDRDGE